jgi:Na+-transporting methylmalonyl-CoA/oxaloacetate decarboxylase gamma subunit
VDHHYIFNVGTFILFPQRNQLVSYYLGVGMIFSFLVLSLLTFVAWLDERLEHKQDPVLGEEWDFTKPTIKKLVDKCK